MASFVADMLGKKTRLKTDKVLLGKGNIWGVASPEAANKAGVQTPFVLLLTLGISPNAVMFEL